MNKARGHSQRGARKKSDCRPSKIMEVMAAWQCTVCDRPCEDEEHTERSIECFVCKKWAHQACTGLTDNMFDNLTKAPNTQWVCTPCLENKGESRDERKLDKLLSMIPLMESLTARMEKLEEVLMGKKLEERIEEVVERKVTEMRETLKDKLEIIETEKKGQLAEIEDRIRRKTNLVIFRLKEAKEEDEQKVKKVLTELRTKHTPVDIRRLGHFNKGSEKPRPLRISFDNEQARDEVLSSVYRVLKNKEEEDKRLCTQVSTRKDLTVQEREEKDRLYAELKRRRQDSKESGDDKAKWVRRRGRVVNIGNYKVEEEEKANQADRGPQVEGEETD